MPFIHQSDICSVHFREVVVQIQLKFFLNLINELELSPVLKMRQHLLQEIIVDNRETNNWIAP